MAVGKWHWYALGLEKAIEGSVDFDTDTFKALLCDENYTPAQDTHDFVADAVAAEIGDAGYARQTLGSLLVSLSSGEVRWDFADIDFGNAVTLTAKYVLIYKEVTNDADSILIGFLDLNTATTGSTVSSTNGNFDIQINAAGALKITREAYSAGN